MANYGERLNDAMKLRTVSTSMLAKEIGITYQAVKKILDGKSAALSAENNAKAAKYLQINSYWLATGEDAMAIPEASTAAALSVLIQRLSHELQTVDAANRPLLAHAIKSWADTPEQWERLVQQLRNLGVDAGLATPAEAPALPRQGTGYFAGTTIYSDTAPERRVTARRAVGGA